MSFTSEFKAFTLRGNVVDMAVGVIIGAAFGAIVASMVSDILMPIVGAASGGVNFKDKFVMLGGDQGAKLMYGNLIDATIKFIIIALALFAVIKAMNAAKKKEEAKPAAPPPPTREEVLLAEIRDLLKRGAKA